MDNPGPSHLKSAMCDICGKAFTPGNLKKHMRMHGDNRPKKCTYCDREFPTYKAMTGHRKFAHAEQYKTDRDGQTVAKLPDFNAATLFAQYLLGYFRYGNASNWYSVLNKWIRQVALPRLY